MRSMTGYGAGSAEAAGVRIAIELRGTNQRFLDVKLTAPREYAAWETAIRDQVRTTVERGRVDVTVTRTVLPGARRFAVTVREDVAEAYVAAARGLAQRLGLAADLGVADVLRLPDLFDMSARAPDLGAEEPALQRALAAALKAFDAERRREGKALAADMAARVAAIRAHVRTVRRRMPAVTRALVRQARERLHRLAADLALEPGRVAHEAAVLADRSDVTEELVRLESHLGALAAALRAREAVGKRIEFLLQEVHRELNTAGVKAADLAVTERIVAAKGEVEKLREQVQNVE